jgi:hypothetical protein
MKTEELILDQNFSQAPMNFQKFEEYFRSFERRNLGIQILYFQDFRKLQKCLENFTIFYEIAGGQCMVNFFV